MLTMNMVHVFERFFFFCESTIEVSFLLKIGLLSPFHTKMGLFLVFFVIFWSLNNFGTLHTIHIFSFDKMNFMIDLL